MTPTRLPGHAFVQRLPAQPVVLDSRPAIEQYFHRLDQASHPARRRVARWSGARSDSFRLAAVPLAPGKGSFLGEAAISFGLQVQAQARAPSHSYTVGVVLAGSMRLRLTGGECVVGPAQGVIIDPGEIECSEIAAGSHFVEFSLPKQELRRLGAEVAGDDAALPRFAPLLRGDLPQRLLFMAMQAAGALQTQEAAARPLFRRWTETIGLTLLHEQPQRGAHGASALEGDASPSRLRRALEFIDAHAHANIELADVAAAACLSASSLLRMFREHLGQSPGAYLRQVRLERARAELRSGSAPSVRDVAQRCGFLNASKFSQAYLRQFGELPRDALARR